MIVQSVNLSLPLTILPQKILITKGSSYLHSDTLSRAGESVDDIMNIPCDGNRISHSSLADHSL